MSKLKSKVEKMNPLLKDVSQGLTYERERRRSLHQTVEEHLIERLDDRSKNAYSMMEYERKIHSLRDELSEVRRGFEDLRTRQESLQIQHKNLVRDHKNLLRILEKGGHIRPRKKPRTDSSGGADQHRT